MQRLNTAYTVYFNDRHQRAGHLFQGRYKAILIDADSYLLELSRYIHLNPVRIERFRDMTAKEKSLYLECYRWSSFPAYIGKAPCGRLIHRALILDMLSNNASEAPSLYKQFVLEGIEKKITSPIDGVERQIILGKNPFRKWAYKTFIEGKRKDKEYTKLEKSLPSISMEQIINSVASDFGVEQNEILQSRSKHSLARQFLIDFCCRYLINQSTLEEIGRCLGGISVSGMGISRKRLKARLNKDPQLLKRFERLKKEILS